VRFVPAADRARQRQNVIRDAEKGQEAICVWDNVEANFGSILGNPNLALAEFRCGAHGCKFGLLGESVGHDLVVEFIEGAQRELRRTRASGPLTAPYPVGL